MDSFLRLPPAERHLAFQQVEGEMGLQAASVEKDFWVCWTLRELVTLPGSGERLTFKGGTSLSKAWKLIERFSEDIDLVVDKEALGFGGDASPDNATGKNERKRRLENLMAACQAWVQGTLQPALAARIMDRLGEEAGKTLGVDPDVADGQCLLFEYPGVFKPTEAGYVRPVVKIELGARSDDWPSEPRSIKPYVAEQFPEMIPNAEAAVKTLAPERTFWEKACLLHEETFRPAEKPRKIRLARHYYDVWRLITKGVADKALANPDLFKRVAQHREIFFRWTWVDYTTLRPGSFRLAPPAEHEAEWRKDYEAMRGPMFFGEMPKFEEILKVVGEFEKRFNQSAPG